MLIINEILNIANKINNLLSTKNLQIENSPKAIHYLNALFIDLQKNIKLLRSDSFPKGSNFYEIEDLYNIIDIFEHIINDLHDQSIITYDNVERTLKKLVIDIIKLCESINNKTSNFQSFDKQVSSISKENNTSKKNDNKSEVKKASIIPLFKQYPSNKKIYDTKSKWAILIGINEYEDINNYKKLNVCINDIKSIYDRLILGGFNKEKIQLITDDSKKLPSRSNIYSALNLYAKIIEPNDLLLIYFSGHGEFENGESYLIPKDGKKNSLQDTAIEFSRVKEIIKETNAKAKVIILDACHSGSQVGSKGPIHMSEGFFKRVFEEAKGLVIQASCEQGQSSYEWPERKCSVFTYYFLEALSGKADNDNKGCVSVQDVNRYVVDKVKIWASKLDLVQVPTFHCDMSGDIILSYY